MREPFIRRVSLNKGNRTLGEYLFIALLSITCLATPQDLTTPPSGSNSSASTTTAPPPVGKIVELSVHGERRLTAMIVWDTGGSVTRYFSLDVPFLLEWVVAPPNATGFMIVPTGTERLPEPRNWILLNAGEDANTYVSLRSESETTPVVDGSAREGVVRRLKKRPSASSGWTYLGNWSPSLKTWKTVYWVEAEGADKLATRKKLTEKPEGMIGKSIVADFPVRLREKNTADSGEVDPGQLLRPGTTVRVEELRYDVTALIDGVWARVSLQ